MQHRSHSSGCTRMYSLRAHASQGGHSRAHASGPHPKNLGSMNSMKTMVGKSAPSAVVISLPQIKGPALVFITCCRHKCECGAPT